MEITQTGNPLIFSDGPYFIIRERNSNGLYDVGLGRIETISGVPEIYCLYENLTENEWRDVQDNGGLEKIFDEADSLLMIFEFWATKV